jgi:uncharacterized repeat protein (TIGR03847 family)
MTDSYSFDDVEFFTVGTLGPLGERVFYLQCRGDGELLSLRLEKQQVSGLADYLERVLTDLPLIPSASAPGDLSLREPAVAAWTVGAMGVAYQSFDERIIIIAEELVDDDREPAQARFSLRLDQVAGLIERSRTVVESGRPPCEICGRPLSPRFGGWCACSN